MSYIPDSIKDILVNTGIKTANYTASAGEFVPVDGEYTVTLPAAPNTGDQVAIQNLSRSVSVGGYVVIIDSNGKLIEEGQDRAVYTYQGICHLRYDGTQWCVVSETDRIAVYDAFTDNSLNTNLWSLTGVAAEQNGRLELPYVAASGSIGVYTPKLMTTKAPGTVAFWIKINNWLATPTSGYHPIIMRARGEVYTGGGATHCAAEVYPSGSLTNPRLQMSAYSWAEPVTTTSPRINLDGTDPLWLGGTVEKEGLLQVTRTWVANGSTNPGIPGGPRWIQPAAVKEMGTRHLYWTVGPLYFQILVYSSAALTHTFQLSNFQAVML